MEKKTSQKRKIGKGISKVKFQQLIESTSCLQQATVYTKILNLKTEWSNFHPKFSNAFLNASPNCLTHQSAHVLENKDETTWH